MVYKPRVYGRLSRSYRLEDIVAKLRHVKLVKVLGQWVGRAMRDYVLSCMYL